MKRAELEQEKSFKSEESLSAMALLVKLELRSAKSKAGNYYSGF